MKKINGKLVVGILGSMLSLSILTSCGKTSFKDIDLKTNDFRNCNLGDSVEKVKAVEKFELTDETEQGDTVILVYDNVKLEMKEATITYRFEENELVSATAHFPYDDNVFHQNLKDYCTELYNGRPSITKSDFAVWIQVEKETVLATDFHSLTLSVYNPYYLNESIEMSK